MASGPVATERYENRRLQYSDDLAKWTAHREFDVAFAGDENTALATLQSQLNVYPGSPHDLTPVLICVNLVADKSLFTVIRVRADYIVSSNFTASTDPLKQPAKIEWAPTLQSSVLEHTPDGHVVCTTSGQPFENPPEVDVNTMTLTLTRNQPYYDPVQACAFIDTINADNFTVRGKVMNTAVLPGQCRCRSIAPVGSYTLQAAFVCVRYIFEMRPTFSTDAKGFSDAWDVRIVNKGTQGWYVDPVTTQTVMGYFFDSERQQVTDPVYLDMKGMPLDTNSFKVTRARYPAVANRLAIPTSDAQAGDFTYEQVPANGVPGGFIYILHFRRFKSRPFSGLL